MFWVLFHLLACYCWQCGQKSGFIAMFGIWSGSLIHILLAVLGLSAILVTSTFAFEIVKWIGAIYLIWLGIGLLRSHTIPGQSITEQGKALPNKIFLHGLLVATLNPKVALFFLAFLPQFVVEGAGPISIQILFHGILIIAVAAFINPPVIVLSSRVSAGLKLNAAIRTWLNRSLGLAFIGVGVRIALSEKT